MLDLISKNDSPESSFSTTLILGSLTCGSDFSKLKESTSSILLALSTVSIVAEISKVG